MILRRRHQDEEQGEVFRAEAIQIGLVPGMGSYKSAPDDDLRSIVAAYRKWKGLEILANTDSE